MPGLSEDAIDPGDLVGVEGRVLLGIEPGFGGFEVAAEAGLAAAEAGGQAGVSESEHGVDFEGQGRAFGVEVGFGAFADQGSSDGEGLLCGFGERVIAGLGEVEADAGDGATGRVDGIEPHGEEIRGGEVVGVFQEFTEAPGAYGIAE